MRITNRKNRELLNLSLVVIITIIFSLFSLSIGFLDKILKAVGLDRNKLQLDLDKATKKHLMKINR